jgi:cyclase
MVKTRLIPVLYIKNGLIVRSENFEEHKIIGNVVNEVRRYNSWDIDELVYIDISRDGTFDSRRDDHKINRVNSINEALELIAAECFMPLSFGGGIRNLDTIKNYLRNGADKVIINTLLHTNPEIVKQAIEIFGSQAIVASLDYRIEDGEIKFYKEYGTSLIDKTEFEMAKYVENLGCGEVFLTSMDKDGSGEGYDLAIIEKMVNLFEIPVVACGGAIDIFDFEELYQIEGISGIAAGNMFHFTENIYPRSKKKLKEKNLNFR